jgi:hypothetical protein
MQDVSDIAQEMSCTMSEELLHRAGDVLHDVKAILTGVSGVNGGRPCAFPFGFRFMLQRVFANRASPNVGAQMRGELNELLEFSPQKLACGHLWAQGRYPTALPMKACVRQVEDKNSCMVKTMVFLTHSICEICVICGSYRRFADQFSLM